MSDVVKSHLNLIFNNKSYGFIIKYGDTILVGLWKNY